jgi:hypothetical protein
MKKIISKAAKIKMSDSAKKRCTSEWRKKKSAQMATKLDVKKVKELYEAGYTQTEIAKNMGVSQKVIWRCMKNNNIPARIAAKRNQYGENNSSWKGNDACYSAFHRRLEAKFGKPKKCEVCGADHINGIYDWANLTGHYEDINDYKRMCRSCHWKYDERVNNLTKKGGDASCRERINAF